MTAEHYQSAPLSDELERRIRQRIQQLRQLSDIEHKGKQLYSASTLDGGISALEWVLNEAEAVKSERRPRPDPNCPDCNHVHEGRNECSRYLGEGKFCRCESKVTA